MGSPRGPWTRKVGEVGPEPSSPQTATSYSRSRARPLWGPCHSGPSLLRRRRTEWSRLVQRRSKGPCISSSTHRTGDGASSSTPTAALLLSFPAPPLYPNEWTHIAATCDEDADTFRLFVNGFPEASSSSITDNPSALGALNWFVGSAGPGLNHFDGSIDEVQLFTEVRTDEEIASLYDGSFGLVSSREFVYDDADNVITTFDPTMNPRRLHLDMETFLNGNLEDLSGHGNRAELTGTVDA